jgi:hypothetical protein
MTATARCPPRLLVRLSIILVCLVIAGCGGYTTTTTTKAVVGPSTATPTQPGTTTPAPTTRSVAVTHQSPVAMYGAVFSAVVALVIALSGTFAFLRRPRLKLEHQPDKAREDVVPGGECEWWWRVRVVNDNRSWGLFVPKTAQDVEVFVTSLRRTHDQDGKECKSCDPDDTPVVSGRRIPWTIPHKDKKADPDGIAPVSIPAGTFRYLSAIGPRHAGEGEDRATHAFYAVRLKPSTTPDRYDLDQRRGTWVAAIVVSTDDVRARRWEMTIRVIADPSDRGKDAVTIATKRARL